jgi:hypothetical protein
MIESLIPDEQWKLMEISFKRITEDRRVYSIEFECSEKPDRHFLNHILTIYVMMDGTSVAPVVFEGLVPGIPANTP